MHCKNAPKSPEGGGAKRQGMFNLAAFTEGVNIPLNPPSKGDFFRHNRLELRCFRPAAILRHVPKYYSASPAQRPGPSAEWYPRRPFAIMSGYSNAAFKEGILELWHVCSFL